MRTSIWARLTGTADALALLCAVVDALRAAVITLLASRKSVMGRFTIGVTSRVFGWLTAVLMALAALWMFVPSRK